MESSIDRYENCDTDEEFLMLTFTYNDIAFVDGYREWIVRTRSDTSSSMKDIRLAMTDRYIKFLIRNGMFKQELLQLKEVKTYIERDISEADKFCLAVYGILPLETRFVNKWYGRIIYELINNTGAYCLDDIEHIAAYTNKYISARFIDRRKLLKDASNIRNTMTPYLFNGILESVVNLGRLFRTESDGFNDSELYYLTAGMAYINVLNKRPTTFNDIIKEISRIIQVNPTAIVLNAITAMSDKKANPNGYNSWSLMTYIRSDGEDNYRYVPALKYFTDYVKRKDLLTIFERRKPNGDSFDEIRIITNYNRDRLIEANKWLASEVDNLFGMLNDDNINWEFYEDRCFAIYRSFIDTQQFTRGTCIIGQILLSYLLNYHKWVTADVLTVRASNKDELPDWAAVAGVELKNLFHEETFNDTVLVDTIKSVPVDTLTMLFQYRALITSYQ